MSFVDFVSMLMSEKENALECAFLSAPHDPEFWYLGSFWTFQPTSRGSDYCFQSTLMFFIPFGDPSFSPNSSYLCSGNLEGILLRFLYPLNEW